MNDKASVLVDVCAALSSNQRTGMILRERYPFVPLVNVWTPLFSAERGHDQHENHLCPALAAEAFGVSTLVEGDEGAAAGRRRHEVRAERGLIAVLDLLHSLSKGLEDWCERHAHIIALLEAVNGGCHRHLGGLLCCQTKHPSAPQGPRRGDVCGYG
jgi:hypothetical protein